MSLTHPELLDSNENITYSSVYYLKKLGISGGFFYCEEKRTVISGTYGLEIYLAIFSKLYAVLLRAESARAIVKHRSVIAVTKALLLSRSEVLARPCNSFCRKKKIIAICLPAPRDTCVYTGCIACKL